MCYTTNFEEKFVDMDINFEKINEQTLNLSDNASAM